MVTKGFYTTADLAIILDVARTTIEVWRKEGHGPSFVRIKTTIRYPIADFKTWLEKSRAPQVAPTTEEAIAT